MNVMVIECAWPSYSQRDKKEDFGVKESAADVAGEGATVAITHVIQRRTLNYKGLAGAFSRSI